METLDVQTRRREQLVVPGRWQGALPCEFDGPGTGRVAVQVMGSG